jgi:hypothetical protein
LDSFATVGASPRQIGHHGAQNHMATGLPASEAPSKVAPSSVVAVNRSRSGTLALRGSAADGV